MVCSEVRPQLLAPDAARELQVAEHLAACAACGRLLEALGRLDGAVQAALVVGSPAELQARLARLVERQAAPARLDQALYAALVVGPPAELQARLAATVATEEERSRAVARMEQALLAAVVVEAPAELRMRLAELGAEEARKQAAARVEQALRSSLVMEAPAQLKARLVAVAQAGVVDRSEEAIRSAVVVEAPAALQARLLVLAPADDGLAWLPGLWHMVRTRPAVFAGQLAALAVLAYALTQVASWLGTLPVVLGDIPYALELLLLSPAVDYLGQVEGLLQQLALWLLVGAAGWLLAQGLSWQRREPAP